MTAFPYFSKDFVQQLMQNHKPGESITVSNIVMLDVDNSASILAVLASARTDKVIGHFGMEVTFTKNGEQQVRQMVMKIKPHGLEIVDMLSMLAQACGGELAPVYEEFKSLTGFQHTHLKEQEIYSKLQPSFTPEIFGLYTDNENQVYIILMEYLQDVQLLNSVMSPEQWSDEHIKSTLTRMARWHNEMLNTSANLDLNLWDDAPSLQYMTGLLPLWQTLLNNAADKNPELYYASRISVMQEAINNIGVYWQQLDALPKTLIHNDLNPRNSCFKIIKDKMQFCLYDWELATFHIPQYDVVEFLCFVLDEDRYEKRQQYLEFYRKELNALTGKYEDAELFKNEFYLAAFDFGIHRLGMYMMAHAVSPYPFLPRVVNSYFDTVMSGDNTGLK